ncbi:alpha/beta fold hydrolase [Verrucomicrobiales bacterium]|nr:alpha/beta fold hydrolase [Verrucomicrobiales bacterium]
MLRALCAAFLLASCSTPDLGLRGDARSAKEILVLPPLERVTRAGAGRPVVVPHGTYNFAAKTAVSDREETRVLDPDTDPALAADFIAPLAAYFHALPQARDRINGILLPEKYPRRDRLIRVGDTPGKTPVVLVHGLGVSPHTWKKMSAKLLISPDFRSKHSLWHYRYPTGAAIKENSRLFVEDLDKALGNDGSEAVIIGHSMGGLLALTAASDPSTSRHISSVILLACPASGNWLATIPEAKIASSFPGIADLSSSSDFIRDLTKKKVPETIPVHVVLGRKHTFEDKTFSDGIVRSTDAYKTPTSTYIVTTRNHQIHKNDLVIDYVTKLLAIEAPP